MISNRLPDWTKKVFPDGDMRWISNRSFAIKTDTPRLARLKAGFLIMEIFQRFHNRTIQDDMTPSAMYIYSAHDTTIGNVLNALGLFKVSLFFIL